MAPDKLIPDYSAISYNTPCELRVRAPDLGEKVFDRVYTGNERVVITIRGEDKFSDTRGATAIPRKIQPIMRTIIAIATATTTTITTRTKRLGACSVGTVPFRSPMQVVRFLPFQNGKNPLFTMETVAERNGTVPTEQALIYLSTSLSPVV